MILYLYSQHTVDENIIGASKNQNSYSAIKLSFFQLCNIGLFSVTHLIFLYQFLLILFALLVIGLVIVVALSRS